MPENEQKDWLTVRETAERLGRSEETVRRMIRACKLPASRSGEGPRAAWLINASALERQLEVQATEQRVRDRGIVTGYGDFIEQVEARYGAPLADTLREVRERHELLERLATELHADPDVAERFEQLDDEERIERAAQELARRVRREERIRERAREILEEDDTDWRSRTEPRPAARHDDALPRPTRRLPLWRCGTADRPPRGEARRDPLRPEGELRLPGHDGRCDLAAVPGPQAHELLRVRSPRHAVRRPARGLHPLGEGARPMNVHMTNAARGPLLTARTVAETLGVSAETVLRWTRRGELPAFRLPGGAIRYREGDVETWLKQRTTHPEKE